jgi:hypothetical protein
LGRNLRVVLVVLICCPGCGKDEEKLAPVRGTVYFNGEPLHGGTIVFTPDPERGGSGPVAVAEVAADGTYHLHTEKQEGATPGWHRVTLAGNATPLPARYCDPERSQENHEVKAGKVNVIDIRLP